MIPCIQRSAGAGEVRLLALGRDVLGLGTPDTGDPRDEALFLLQLDRSNRALLSLDSAMALHAELGQLIVQCLRAEQATLRGSRREPAGEGRPTARPVKRTSPAAAPAPHTAGQVGPRGTVNSAPAAADSLAAIKGRVAPAVSPAQALPPAPTVTADPAPPPAGETFGQFVRRARMDLGLTQVQFAARIGVHQPELSALELDKFSLPRKEIVRRIATELGEDETMLQGLIFKWRKP